MLPPARVTGCGGRGACERLRHYPLEVYVNLFSERDLSPDLKRLRQDFSPPGPTHSRV